MVDSLLRKDIFQLKLIRMFQSFIFPLQQNPFLIRAKTTFALPVGNKMERLPTQQM